MCFSATASFTMAAGLGAVGVYTQALATGPRSRVLAAFPLLFSIQQLIEGVIWLALDGVFGTVSDGALRGLASGFLIFAFVLWPIITPIATGLIEPSQRRRQFMLVLAGVGGLVGLYLLVALIRFEYLPAAALGHITYKAEINHPLWLELAYAAAVLIPLIIASFRPVMIFGLVVWLGAAVSYFNLEMGRASVWCFFAAGASVILIWHFRTERSKPI